MNDRKWTLVLLEEGREELRQITIRGRSLKRALWGGSGLLGSAFAVLLGLAWVGSGSLTNLMLERENKLLVSELESMRDRVSDLQVAMDDLIERDRDVRMVAGLPTLDEETLDVGVGGPGAPSLESNPLFQIRREVGAEAFAVQYDLNALERRAELLRESLSEAADSVSMFRDMLEATPSILPVNGIVRSQYSAARFHPIHNRVLPHDGIDISAPTGTPIVAAARGRVITASRQSGYGLTVVIDHGFGVTTVYAHTSRMLVRVGQTVERGEVIAQVGATGVATSPHLHYEVRVNGRSVDPMNYILP
jgi:murein DD-endopeptidase MepM/ murein hydrolase activator NlpD